MRILLIMQADAGSHALAKNLRQHSYAVDFAATEEDALFKSDVNSYSALLLDTNLERADPLLLCQAIRRQGFQRSILMLSDRNAVQDRIQSLDAGADDYLAKPYEVCELLARLRALSRRCPVRLAEHLVIGNLEIDTCRHLVCRDDQLISLTRKEYVILEYMARRKEEVITRADIAEHVWDESFNPLSNLIEVYMLRLRRKIDAPFSAKLLRTHRGEGYKLSTSLTAM